MQEPGHKRLAIALVLSAGLCFGTVMVAQELVLTKPLSQFTIGDVFPKAVDDSFAETGRSWKGAANELLRAASARKESVAAAVSLKENELPNTKRQLLQAKKEKDLARIGALDGTLKSEELVLDILERLDKLSDDQIELAESWKAAGEAMEKFTAADSAFDLFRTRQLARPGLGEVDQRLGADGYRAFKAHAEAMNELGDAFSELGSRTESLARNRLKLMKSLEKGGHVQAPE